MNTKQLIIVFTIVTALLFASAEIIDAIRPASQPCEPTPELTLRPQFGTYPPDCGHLYNTGRSKEWQECMGIGPVTPAAALELYREDL